MRSKRKNVPYGRILLFFLGSCLAVNALLATILSNFHTGTLLTWMLSLCFLFGGIFQRQIQRAMPRVIRLVILCLLLLPLLAGTALFAFGSIDTVTYEEDVLIVLGAGIRGETLGKSLKLRLDRALDYHEKNPDAFILVSGGQGPEEDITEALAMERYLLASGIPASKIVKEEGATSTGENFKFGKIILDERLNDSYSVCVITNDYHVYRARYLASVSGLQDVHSCHAETSLYNIIPSTLRECLAVIKSWIFKM